MDGKNDTGLGPTTEARAAWRCRGCGGSCPGRRLPLCEACDALALRDPDAMRLLGYSREHSWSSPAALVRAVCAAYGAPLPTNAATYEHAGWLAQQLGWRERFDAGAPMTEFVLPWATVTP